MTSSYTSFPVYGGYTGYVCQCGAPLDIRYQNIPYYQSSSQIEYAAGYCHACYRQVPLHRTRMPNHMSHSAPYTYAPWYRDNSYYNEEPEAYTWRPQRQFYQHHGMPRVNHTYYPLTANRSLDTQHPSFYSNTSHYQNEYEVPRSTEPRQQWSAGRSENRRRQNRSSASDYPRERGRSYSWQSSSSTRTVNNSTDRATSIADSGWSTRTTAGSHRSSSEASRSIIDYTPSPESDEDNIGASHPYETEDREERAAEEDDEEKPFLVAGDGSFVLLGDQWQVPSRTEAIREAGEPVGHCDIISTHKVTDENGNTIEVDIKEKNCEVSRTMSGGLAD